MLHQTPQKIPEWHDVDEKKFREDIVTPYRPAVLRGLVKAWPAVQAALKSPADVSRCAKRADSCVPAGFYRAEQVVHPGRSSRAAMSMVRFAEPDFDRFPRFKDALVAAFVAELEPGDAIFIPTLWWHHVESLDAKLNVLVNYWWNGALGTVERTASAMDCLLHRLLNVRPMPPELRKAWASMFHHSVFDASEDRFKHIPDSESEIC